MFCSRVSFILLKSSCISLEPAGQCSALAFAMAFNAVVAIEILLSVAVIVVLLVHEATSKLLHIAAINMSLLGLLSIFCHVFITIELSNYRVDLRISSSNPVLI